MVKYVSLMQVIHTSNWGAFRNVSSVVENSAKFNVCTFCNSIEFLKIFTLQNVFPEWRQANFEQKCEI